MKKLCSDRLIRASNAHKKEFVTIYVNSMSTKVNSHSCAPHLFPTYFLRILVIIILIEFTFVKDECFSNYTPILSLTSKIGTITNITSKVWYNLCYGLQYCELLPV